MKKYRIVIVLFLTAVVLFVFNIGKRESPIDNKGFVTYIFDPAQHEFGLYWKNDQQQIISSLGNLRDWLTTKGKVLVFAMNAGMFSLDHAPKGLFIDNYMLITPLDTVTNGYGNFYLQPNGVFYLKDDNRGGICTTNEFKMDDRIKYATQSGPMLLLNGVIHPAFQAGSTNLYDRNGVGIMPDGSTVFAMSKSPLNFYDFAAYFKSLGCEQALYLDGGVSRTYCREDNWLQTDGEFGPLIGICTKK